MSEIKPALSCELHPDGKINMISLQAFTLNVGPNYFYTAADVDRALAAAQKDAERLREELAAAQKDAAMFLWLADAEPFSARWQIVRLEWWRGRDGWSDVRGEALRSAIGAAMAQEKRDE